MLAHIRVQTAPVFSPVGPVMIMHTFKKCLESTYCNALKTPLKNMTKNKKVGATTPVRP